MATDLPSKVIIDFLFRRRLRSGARLEQDLRPTIIALVEMLVGVWCLIKRQPVRDDLGRIGPAMLDKAHQPPVIMLHITLSGADLLTLEPKVAEVERNLAFLLEIVGRVRVFRHEHADDADSAGGLRAFDEAVHRVIAALLAVAIATLVSDRLDPPVGPEAAGRVKNLLGGIALPHVDRNGAHRLGQLETVIVRIDHEDLRGTTNFG